MSAGGAEKADELAFPSAAGLLNEVLRRGIDVVVVNRNGQQDRIGALDRVAQRRDRQRIARFAIAQCQWMLAEIQKLHRRFMLTQDFSGAISEHAGTVVGFRGAVDGGVFFFFFPPPPAGGGRGGGRSSVIASPRSLNQPGAKSTALQPSP